MKKLALFLFIVAATVVGSFAQSYETVTLLPGGTQNIPSSATSNYTAIVNVRRAEVVGIFTSFKLTGAGTDNIVFKLAKSVDGSTFETTPSISITVAATGTTVANTYTAGTVTGVRDLKLVSVQNGSASEAVTNLTVKIGIKNIATP